MQHGALVHNSFPLWPGALALGGFFVFWGTLLRRCYYEKMSRQLLAHNASVVPRLAVVKLLCVLNRIDKYAQHGRLPFAIVPEQDAYIGLKQFS